MCFKGYENKVLVGEDIAEIEHRPHKCARPYRLIIVRKNINVQKGERVLFDEIRYFFYITNRGDYPPEQIVSLANGRCHQENVIEQLKNGVNAMRMPVDDLLSNWAYMVMASLAWNLKAWFALLLPNARRGAELITMEFRRFLHAIVLLPAQIVRTGRRVIASSEKDSPDSTPPARALRSMQTGQNSFSLLAEKFAPQTLQARISRVIKSSCLSRDSALTARSILRRLPKLRKVHESAKW